jgi:LysR substrate binding domain
VLQARAWRRQLLRHELPPSSSRGSGPDRRVQRRTRPRDRAGSRITSPSLVGSALHSRVEAHGTARELTPRGRARIGASRAALRRTGWPPGRRPGVCAWSRPAADSCGAGQRRRRRALCGHAEEQPRPDGTQPPRAWPTAAGPGTYIPLVAEPLRLLVPAGHPLAGQPAASLAEVAGDRWIHGWGEVGDVTDMLAAFSGFRPQVACRSSDYRFMSALVGAGVGVALVPASPSPAAHWCATCRLPPTHPLHRRLAPQTAPAKPGRRAAGRCTARSRPRYTRDPDRTLLTSATRRAQEPGAPALSPRQPPQIDCSERHERLATQA